MTDEVSLGVECEAKFRSPRGHGFEVAIRLLSDVLGQNIREVGSASRTYTYYDVGNALASSGRTFRVRHRKKGGYKYQYKYPVDAHPQFLVRREITHRTRFDALDSTDPFHRRLPVFSELSRFLGPRLDVAQLSPRVVMHQSRDMYVAHDLKNEVALALHVTLDRVIAKRLDGSGKSSEFLELEIEVTRAYPNSYGLLEDCVACLQKAEYLLFSKTKYAAAMEDGT